MTDFATLALQIDSTEVAKGVGDLDKLTQAGSRAEKQADQLHPALQRVGASAGQQRAAMQQLSYQIGDVAQGFAMGVNPMMIFAQQGGQVVQALGLMQGEARGLIGFLGGPWGAVIMGAVTIAGTFAAKLFDTSSAMDEVKFSSFALKDAQGILGNVMDMTTGKINKQVPALVALARAQLAVARVQSQTRAAEARSQIASGAKPAWYEYFSLTDKRGPDQFRRNRSSELGADLALSGNYDAAIKKVTELQKAGKITNETFTLLATAYANLGVENANTGVFDSAEKLLNGTGGRETLKTAKTPKNRADNSGIKEAAEYAKKVDALAASIGNNFAEAGVFVDKLATQTLTSNVKEYEEGVGKILAEQNKQIDDRIEKRREELTLLDAQKASMQDMGRAIFNIGGIGTTLGPVIAALGGDSSGLGGAARLLYDSTFTTVDPQTGKRIANDFGRELDKVFGNNGKFFKAIQGAGTGLAVGSLVFGQNNTGAQIGAALGGGIGGVFAKDVGGAVAKSIGKGAGAILGKITEGIIPVIGGLLGGLIGSIFGKAKYGTASLSGSGVSVGGNSAGAKSAASSAGNAISSALDTIASQLGGSVGNYSVSIGTYKDKWRVSPSGMTGKLNKGDTVDFGKEGGQAALLYAISDAIRDGAIQGIRASTQRILAGGSDVEKQLAKALKFQGVFDELKSKTDPMGYALEQLTREFDALRKIFDEAGASAEEYASLEELLAKKRQDATEQARQTILDNLRDPIALQIRALELMGNAEDALAASRLTELAGMKATLQPLQSMIYQLSDAQDIIAKFGPLSDDLKKFRSELLGGSGNGSYGFIAAQFRSTAASAAMGDATALGNLRGSASAFLDAAKENASSALEYQRIFGEVLASVDKGIFAAETQVDYAQAQIDAIKQNSTILEDLKANLVQLQQQGNIDRQTMLRLWQRFEGEGITVIPAQDEPLKVEIVS